MPRAPLRRTLASSCRRKVPRAKPEDLRLGLVFFSLIYNGGPGDVFEVADEMLDEDTLVRETMIQAMLGDKECRDICQENINLALESV